MGAFLLSASLHLHGKALTMVKSKKKQQKQSQLQTMILKQNNQTANHFPLCKNFQDVTHFFFIIMCFFTFSKTLF